MSGVSKAGSTFASRSPSRLTSTTTGSPPAWASTRSMTSWCPGASARRQASTSWASRRAFCQQGVEGGAREAAVDGGRHTVDRHRPGYNAFTLLQLAHATSTLANRGIVMTPHLVKRITDPSTNKAEDVPVEPAAVIPLKSRNVETVIAGMTDVSTKGTARFVFKGVPYTVACKTGTARSSPSPRTTSTTPRSSRRSTTTTRSSFAFAPARNPRIALAVSC